MKTYLIFDTETTGLVNKQLPFNDPAQPHLVSLSVLQVRLEDGEPIIQQSMSKVVIPAEWDWDDSEDSQDRAFAVHQLTMEHCETFGRTEADVVSELVDLYRLPETEIVAHNLDFDRAVIAAALARYTTPTQVQTWLDLPGTCTMRSSKDIVQAQTKPNAKTGKTRLKNPNLAEAYEHFTGEPLERHHSANADTVACYMIWQALMAEGAVE